MTKLRNSFLSIGLVIATSLTFVQPAQADSPAVARMSEDLGITSAPIEVPDLELDFARTSITSTPAPKMEAPVVAVQYNQPEAATTVTRSAPVAKKEYAAPATPVYVAPAPTPAPARVGNSSAVASAALAQLGVGQDCTMLVTNSLAAIGINFHSAPAGYLSLGTITSNPVPGDLIYYGNAGAGVPHIAVYIGNGQAVHGGWNGGTTAIFSANIGSGPVYIHI